MYLLKIADRRRSSALSGSNCRLFVTITAPGDGLPQVLRRERPAARISKRRGRHAGPECGTATVTARKPPRCAANSSKLRVGAILGKNLCQHTGGVQALFSKLRCLRNQHVTSNAKFEQLGVWPLFSAHADGERTEPALPPL